MTVNVSKPAINVREKLAELDKPSGIAGEAMLRAETPQEQQALIGVGRRNILINGDFQVSQRADYSGGMSVSGGYYYLDRWYSVVSTINPTITHTDVQLPNGQYVKSMKIAATAGTGAGTGYCQMRQKIERYYHLRGQYVTLSCWFKTTKGDNSGVNLAVYDNGSVAGWLKGDDLPNDGNWHFVTFTTKLSDTISAYPEITIQHNNTWQSGEYYEVALMQLELGKVATPFEHRSYGEELALCQRYYETFKRGTVGAFVDDAYFVVGHAVANNRVESVYSYKVVKRSQPTVSFSGTAYATNSSGAGQASSNSNVTFDVWGTRSTAVNFNADIGTPFNAGDASRVYIGSSSTFAFDAEL